MSIVGASKEIVPVDWSFPDRSQSVSDVLCSEKAHTCTELDGPSLFGIDILADRVLKEPCGGEDLHEMISLITA